MDSIRINDRCRHGIQFIGHYHFILLLLLQQQQSLMVGVTPSYTIYDAYYVSQIQGYRTWRLDPCVGHIKVSFLHRDVCYRTTTLPIDLRFCLRIGSQMPVFDNTILQYIFCFLSAVSCMDFVAFAIASRCGHPATMHDCPQSWETPSDQLSSLLLSLSLSIYSSTPHQIEKCEKFPVQSARISLINLLFCLPICWKFK